MGSNTFNGTGVGAATLVIGEVAAGNRRGGLRGLWNWLRRSVLRLGRTAPARKPGIKPVVREVGIQADPAATEAGDEAPPLDPVGVKFREHPVSPVVAMVPMAPVREGLAIVPPLPHVIRELLRELSDPTSSAKTVARIAATDPALAATLLRTVNSAAVGLRRKVTSVADAVSFLGYSLVRSLVIRMRLDTVLATKAGQPAYDQEDLWVHSLAVAYAAEMLAERVPGIDKGFVSTLGLLHDIGKLAINSQFPESAALIRTPAVDPEHSGESFLDRERRILGADHAEIGAILAGHWKLPPDLIEAIRWHHNPTEMPADLPVGVRAATILVHVANQLTKYCYVYSEDMEIDIIPNELLRQVGLPGPVTRLLNMRLKQVISRAIFFADETSRHPLGAIRRFVRLRKGPPGITVPATVARGEAHVSWADEEWEDTLPCEPVAIDCDPATGLRMESALRGAGRAGRFHCMRFSARATSGGVDRLLTATTTHQQALDLDDESQMPVRFLLRRLLPNLREIDPGAPIEIIQCLYGGTLLVALRSPALRFLRRFGEGISESIARTALDRELANVLNLRWFSRIRATRDGKTLMFIAQATGT